MSKWFARLRCLANRHKPGGGNVEWDGRNYISNCGRCAKPIRRYSKGDWRKDRAPSSR